MLLRQFSRHSFTVLRQKLNIAVLLSLRNAFGQGVLKGVSHFARLHPEWSLLWLDIETILVPGFAERYAPDGIIVHLSSDAMAAAAAAAGSRVVNVSNRHFAQPVTTVTSDDKAAGRLCARYFIERNYQQLAFIGHEEKRSYRQRCEGFRSEAGERAVATTEHWVEGLGPTGFYSDAEECRLVRWMESLPKPVGVMVSSDRYASYFIDFCLRHGIRVPEEVAVVGVDNDPLKNGLCRIPLSSVELGVEMVGFRAAKLLSDLIRGTATPGGTVYIPPVRVVERASSEHFSVTDLALNDALQHIYKHIHEFHSVEDLASFLKVSRRTLERRWAKQLGDSPLNELRRIRIRKAKKLLLETNLSCKEVASAVGLPDNRSLTLLFRTMEDTTPSAYRKRRGPVQDGVTGMHSHR